jgi:predicted flap endonuclease-1-like 5' DNA nuclease
MASGDGTDDAMGPMLWWWRWWLGDDPNRDRQLTEARGLLDEQRTHADELADQMKARDREIADLRARAATLDQARAEADDDRSRLTAQLEQARAEADDDRTRLTAQLEQARAEADRLAARLAEAGTESDADEDADTTADATAADGPPDVEEAREVLGSKVTADDLTLVEGVGPKIAGLLTDAGIDSWRALADADVERLRLVLAEAGPRYRMHDPSSWPIQGRLLAEGRWQDFKDLATG